MKLHPITFRCTGQQLARLNEATLHATQEHTRTAVITAALQDFLDYVEHGEGAKLNLFQLVEKLDSAGSCIPFGEQA